MRPDIEGMENIMETVVKDSRFFINSEFGHHLSIIQFVSFLE